MYFRYLQLRHALLAQDRGGGIPAPVRLPLLDIIIGDNPSRLISALYLELRTNTNTFVSDRAKRRWERDVGPLEESDWDDILDTTKLCSPKQPGRLTQIYILHRTYLTPLRISKYRPDHSSKCPRCDDPAGTFLHLLWSCPMIQTYWTQVINFLHDQMGSPLQLDPRPCILGLLSEINVDKFFVTFLHKSLFLDRRLITRYWMRATPPTVQMWKIEVNTTLPYKRVIYLHRGCPAKFGQVWDRWLNSPDTCSD